MFKLRSSVGTALLIATVIVAVSCSCSDKGTDPINQDLVGKWQRTATYADGVLITPENDEWNVYDQDTIDLKADGTGEVTDKYGTYQILNWHSSRNILYLSLTELGDMAFPYSLNEGKLTFFFPGDEEYNIPDMEHEYSKIT